MARWLVALGSAAKREKDTVGAASILLRKMQVIERGAINSRGATDKTCTVGTRVHFRARTSKERERGDVDVGTPEPAQ